MDEESSRFVETTRWRIHYKEFGVGQPVVLIHNTGPGSTGWNNFRRSIQALAAKFRVLAVDLPGWGQSDEATQETGRDHIAALREMFDALGIDRAALVGNSRGGRVALTFAARHGERVSHLVTVGSSTPGHDIFAVNGRSDVSHALHGAYESPTIEHFQRLVEVMSYDHLSLAEDAELLLESALSRPQHLRNWLAFEGTEAGRVSSSEDPTRLLRALQCPTLVFHGRNDRSVHYENALRLVSLVAGSQLVLLDRCGHWLQMERAPQFTRYLIDFLSNN